MKTNPEKFGHQPNESSTTPFDEEKISLADLTSPEYQDTSHLEMLDAEEQAAYQLYRRVNGISSDDEETVEDFDDHYWGTFESIEEFLQNWVYENEPIEAVQQLLFNFEHLGKQLTLAEMALIDRLQNDLDFIFDGNKVSIFIHEQRKEQ